MVETNVQSEKTFLIKNGTGLWKGHKEFDDGEGQKLEIDISSVKKKEEVVEGWGDKFALFG